MILRTEILRLDWQRIASIQNLDIFTNVRELYLQHNRIEKIEELDTLRSLEFLALGSNRIRRVENLRHLNKVSGQESSYLSPLQIFHFICDHGAGYLCPLCPAPTFFYQHRS